ncbi:DUF5063 domain-containing protein [Solicola gregarius]|uniref:DUF5063 domain-containing protein n=1 Tax=Solicola gregarius TaxID=2908642 RepID=A0AA46TLX9_9ACTN|nr:DUF5063 domain-containing protein [Solicola gregarius]UYM07711.1 DUF5063 domain-containing protein [Solicola gregarius]
MTEPKSSESSALSEDVASSDIEDLGQSVADQTKSFLIAVRAMASTRELGKTIPLLLLEVSQLLLAGARLAAQVDFVPEDKYETDVGPDPDLDAIRGSLAETLSGFDEYTEVFDPYFHPPELVTSRISDDIASIAASVAHGLKHHDAGRVEEALWWWQFSYVSSWGGEASASLRALQSIISHDRLDAELDTEPEPV